MANQTVNLPAPAGNGAGAWVDVSSYGSLKTVQVTGTWTLPNRRPTVTIEFSNDATPTGSAAPLLGFGNVGVQQVSGAHRWMRASVSNYRGGAAPAVNVAGNDDGASFAALPVPAGDGAGTTIDTSALGPEKTLQIGDDFTGQCILEVSEDGAAADWSPIISLSAPGSMNVTTFAKHARIRRTGTMTPPGPGTPICTLGGVNAAGGGGGGGGNAVQIPLTNNTGGAVVPGTVVYTNGDGRFGLAKADALATSSAIGLVAVPLANGAKGLVTLLGPLTLTTAQWDAITGGAGGLTPGARYWVSPVTGGKLVPVASVPVAAGQVVEPVCTALSTTIMNINPSQTPVLLS